MLKLIVNKKIEQKIVLKLIDKKYRSCRKFGKELSIIYKTNLHVHYVNNKLLQYLRK